MFDHPVFCIVPLIVLIFQEYIAVVWLLVKACPRFTQGMEAGSAWEYPGSPHRNLYVQLARGRRKKQLPRQNHRQ